MKTQRQQTVRTSYLSPAGAMYLFLISLYLICLAESAPQKEDDCGIVGGEPADIKDFPYQLSLREQNEHICGAAIISKYWAVSAAHCYEPKVKFTLVAGTSLLNQGGSVHPVAKYIPHPSYNRPVQLNNDIAVLQVTKPFPLGSSGVQCIALASQPPSVGTRAIVSGWGATKEEAHDLPNQLQKVVVPVLSNQDCKKPYSTLTEQMICAGYQAGGKDSCQGDSGGPLVADNKLIGVVSFGHGCARPGHPGVYARVDKLNQWVKQVSGNSQC